MRRLYFDYNATTPLAPTAVEFLRSDMALDLRNPSSAHEEGRKARSSLNRAREHIAALLDCEPEELFFNSSATEGSTTVFHSVWKTRLPGRTKIVTTAVEHDSVLKPLEALKEEGADLQFIPVDAKGRIDWGVFERMVDRSTLLVSVMTANNETGFVFPIEKMAEAAHQMGALFHTDAACAVGKIPLSFRNLGVDFMTFSAHKFYGPKGIGGLVTRRGVHLEPLLLGGTQEKGLRAGTENLLGVLCMDQALHFSLNDLEEENIRLSGLRQKLTSALQRIFPECVIHEGADGTLSGTLPISFPGIKGHALVARLDLEGVAASFGSACHSGAMEVSRVLLAMGMGEELAAGGLRLSFGRMTTEEEADELVGILGRVIPEMRKKK